MRPARWWADVLLGARMALAGGPTGLLRMVLTAVGVGLGVALLLGAASFPNMLRASDAREAARSDMDVGEQVAKADDTILVGRAQTTYRGQNIRGRILQPEGPHAPIPPGLQALPGPGEMVVSPALARLLDSAEGALLRERLDYRIVGTIGDAGLSGPHELAFYAGSDALDADAWWVTRRDHFGDSRQRQPLHPVLLLIAVFGCVALLLPVALFAASAVRFGSESRDRRLAGVRLVGADAGMARRIAAGEALVSGVAGVVVGAALFVLGRSFVDRIELLNPGAFPADVSPEPALVALIVAATPVVAVAVTVFSLRRVVIEPLGVTRRSGDVRRRLWWRLLLPLAGLALLAPLAGRLGEPGGSVDPLQVVAGVGLLLLGAATLLPWLVQVVVRRVTGGPVAWQLAIRRLQLDGSASARAVSGIVVAVAGAIGLQMVFAAVEHNFVQATGQDPSRAQVSVYFPHLNEWSRVAAAEDRLRGTPGVTGVRSTMYLHLSVTPQPGTPEAVGEDPGTSMIIADCPALQDIAVIERCADGDVFVVDAADPRFGPTPMPGSVARFEDDSQWAIPAEAQTVRPRIDPEQVGRIGVLATPSAAPAHPLAGTRVSADLTVDAAVPDVIDRVRNTVWAMSPFASVWLVQAYEHDDRYEKLQRGIYAGAALTLLVIGASLLVTMLEQLRERRRLLAILVAVGTRRRTLAWSVLWQAAVPITLGMALAGVFGLTLGAAVLRIADESVVVDWSMLGLYAGIAAAALLLVTAASLPPLMRLARPEGLRTE